MICDINRAVKINYKKWPKEKYKGRGGVIKERFVPYIQDIKKAFEDDIIYWDKGEMSERLKELINSGFLLNDEQLSAYGIFSPGIYYDKNTITPIMHLKETFMIFKNEIRYMEGSFNWSKKKRFNRLIRYKRQNYISEISKEQMNRPSYSLDHANSVIKNFSERKEYKEIKNNFNFRRVRFMYPDGSFQEPMYNLGNLNQNDRLLELLELENVKNLELSHFVSTNTKLVRKLMEVLSQNSKFSLGGILDTKFFGWIRGYGIFESLIGVSTIRPEYTPDFLVDHQEMKSLREQIRFKIYSRIMKGQKHSKVNDYPKVEELWHDKSHFLEYHNSQRADLFFGSMNLSNNSKNTDLQTWVHYPDKRNSEVFKSFKNVLKKAVTYFSKHLLTPEQAVLKNSLTYFMGFGYDQISNEFVRKFSQIRKKEKFLKSLISLNSLDEASRSHIYGAEKSSIELVNLRIKVLGNVIDFFSSLDKEKRLSMKTWLPYILSAMSDPNLNVYEIKTLISLCFTSPLLEETDIVKKSQMNKVFKMIEPVLEMKFRYIEKYNKTVENANRMVEMNYSLYDLKRVEFNARDLSLIKSFERLSCDKHFVARK